MVPICVGTRVQTSVAEHAVYTIIIFYTIVIITILYAPCTGTVWRPARRCINCRHNVIMYERHEKMTSER